MRRAATAAFGLLLVLATPVLVTSTPAHADAASDARQDAQRILGTESQGSANGPGNGSGSGQGSGSGGGSGSNGSGTGTGTGSGTGSGSGTTPDSPPSSGDSSFTLPSGVGEILMWVVIGLGVIALAVGLGALVVNIIRNRGRDGHEDDAEPDAETEVGLIETDSATVRSGSPDELDRLADVAEREGDYFTAVRLRFRAGVLRLHASQRIELDRDTTTGILRRTLADPRFDVLSRRFDEIVYGEQGAGAADVAQQRSLWPQILVAESVVAR